LFRGIRKMSLIAESPGLKASLAVSDQPFKGDRAQLSGTKARCPRLIRRISRALRAEAKIADDEQR
jgi:hypothetical protein